MLLRTDQPKEEKISHLYPLPLRKGEANSPAADAEPIAKLCLGMHSLLRRLKDAATMPHLHGPIYETA